MSKREIDIWDVLFWLAMTVTIVYIIAKLTGLINTLEWLNLLPIISSVFGIGVFYQRVTQFVSKIYARTDYLKSNMDKISTNWNAMSTSMDTVSNSIDTILNKITEHDKRLFSLEKQQKIFYKLSTKKRK